MEVIGCSAPPPAPDFSLPHVTIFQKNISTHLVRYFQLICLLCGRYAIHDKYGPNRPNYSLIYLLLIYASDYTLPYLTILEKHISTHLRQYFLFILFTVEY